MSRLVLINGAPASGKSTLARLLAEDRRFTLVIDIDSIRGALGQWRRDPIAAGLAARRLAVGAASTHLQTGADVIVPQYLARREFIRELENTAAEAGSAFREVVLFSSPEEASRRFDERFPSGESNHRDAHRLQSEPGAKSISSMYRAMLEMSRTRPNTVYIESIAGDVHSTLTALRNGLALDN